MGKTKTRDYSYRSNTKRLMHMMTRPWLRKRTQKALQANWEEITVLRMRLRDATQELNEWRWKVGGADYNMNGQQALELVRQGMADKGVGQLIIRSVDTYPGDIEPSIK